QPRAALKRFYRGIDRPRPVWREGYATAAFERWRGVLGQAGD
ncbi:hypothetical protein K3Z96_26430, partial [Pseudomonas aeruginosa]|nr:hypothetical protein [Pseudomonas aeruginosa]